MMDYVSPPPSHFEEVVPVKRCVGQMQQDVFNFMAELHGWCAPGKATLLVDLVLKSKPSVIVEIGVWGGKSLIPMAYALRENKQGVIYGIDPWESHESVQWVQDEANKHFWQSADHHWVLQHLMGKVDYFGLQNQVRLVKASSENAEPIENIDILHIDGNHAEHTSYGDVIKWAPLVKSGGFVIFDDMKWSEQGKFTTKKATDWLDERYYKLSEITDTCTWGIWVKP